MLLFLTCLFIYLLKKLKSNFGTLRMFSAERPRLGSFRSPPSLGDLLLTSWDFVTSNNCPISLDLLLLLRIRCVSSPRAPPPFISSCHQMLLSSLFYQTPFCLLLLSSPRAQESCFELGADGSGSVSRLPSGFSDCRRGQEVTGDRDQNQNQNQNCTLNPTRASRCFL